MHTFTNGAAPSTKLSDPVTTSATAAELESRLLNHTATIAVIGLGYVGLPLACRFAQTGMTTHAFDVDSSKIERLMRSESYLSHFGAEQVAEGRASEKLLPTIDPGKLTEADVIIACVPTPLTTTRDPDLSYVEATAETIASQLRPGQLVILESTTWPGTTREIVRPILEMSELRAGVDFWLAYSPEREDPGNSEFDTANTPKLVAGIDEASSRLAAATYASIVSEIVPVESLEVAEATKLVENIYRSVNIALVNELKVLFDRMDINVWSVIDAAKTKPFGYQAFYPGPGLGGHCIPIDPFYLTWLARKYDMSTRFVELAGEINANMPRFVMHRITEALNASGKSVRGSRICILGVAYKKDVDDCRESPALALIDLLHGRGADLSFNDPFVSGVSAAIRDGIPTLDSQEISAEFLASQDAVVLVTDHSSYDMDEIVAHSKIVVDTRNATRHVTAGREKIFRA